jgi:CheY-like chemotaxis protein
MKILIIDDNELVARSICRMLRGHETSAVTDPYVALTRLRNGERFDLVLCDLKMPLINGFDVLSEIDAWFHVNPPMLMLMTGDEEVIAMSTASILNKPFTKSQLEAAIAAAVHRQVMRRSARTARIPVLAAS